MTAVLSQFLRLNAEDSAPEAMAGLETSESPVRATAHSIHRALYQPAVSAMALLAASRYFPALWSDSFAAFPEALLDSASASLCPEPQAVLAVGSDRWAWASGAALTAVFAPMQRSLPRTRRTPESSASLDCVISN